MRLTTRKYCTHCGHRNRRAARVCTACGTPFAAPADVHAVPLARLIANPPSRRYCPQCGAAHVARAKFCPQCGHDFRGAAVPREAPVVGNAAPAIELPAQPAPPTVLPPPVIIPSKGGEPAPYLSTDELDELRRSPDGKLTIGRKPSGGSK